MPATATSNPRIAPKMSAFFQATGFCACGGATALCGGGVWPEMGGGPTGGIGGVGGTACGPVCGNALVGNVGGGENWPDGSGVGGGAGVVIAGMGGGVAIG